MERPNSLMSEWSYNFEKDLAIKIEGLKRMQTNYLNFRLLNNSARKIDELSRHCESCSAYKKDYDAILNQIDELTNNEDLLKLYESKMMEVVEHLRKHHQIKSKSYYSSYYAFFGLGLGLVLSLVFNLIYFDTLLSIVSLYAVFIGVIVGRIVGYITDKRMQKIGKTV